ncbi:MAG TPA: trypsin-like peptidase domain-containing protein [Pirellulales bacterium]|jgi:S1-C subfamily serine protease|nr:trypsin-like peptidase domain-containing protein [Pirellulales bacterium]
MATTKLTRASFVALLAAVIALMPKPLWAQEPNGLQAAAAIEGALVDAIAGSEKSVVAIARADVDDPAAQSRVTISRGPAGGGLEAGLPQVQAPRSPGDPDFIPDAYATGVIVDRHGLILTYYHVLRLKSQHYVTTPDRRVYAAHIKAADPRSDLAILEIDADNLTPIRFGDATGLKKGQIVIALGNPFSIARDGQVSASWGIVSNLSRKAPPDDPNQYSPTGKDKLYHFGTLIQTDAKLNLGTSGGALVNLRGEMIGLTTSLAATAGYEQAAGYAVPVDDTFRRVVDALKEGREVEYGYLGVTLENLKDSELAKGAHGARVEIVQGGSPAERAGLHRTDIVTHVNDQSIFDADGLMLEVGRLPVESQVQLTVRRDDREQKIHVELAKYPVRGVKVVTAPSPAWRGLRVDYATALPSDTRRLPYDRISPEGCVVITEVEKDSPAAAAQLQVGMYVTQAGGASVRTPREFQAAVAGKSGDVSLRVFAGAEVNSTEVRTVKPTAG